MKKYVWEYWKEEAQGYFSKGILQRFETLGVFVKNEHDENPPTLIHNKGTISESHYWYNRKGQIHRENGPSPIYINQNYVEWHLYDISYSFEQWSKLVDLPESELALLKLTYC